MTPILITESRLARRVRVVGVDGLLTPKGWITVILQDDHLQAIRLMPDLDSLLKEQKDADKIGVNLPLGHDDPDGDKREGRRACDLAAQEYLGKHGDLVEGVPPFQLLQGDDLDAAREEATRRGWPMPSQTHWPIRQRILDLNETVGDDARFVEVHSEVSFTSILRQLQGPQATLKRRPRSWPGQYERLALLHVAGLRPMRSFGGIGRANPEDVLAATAAAWSAHRVATGKAQTLPERCESVRACISY